MNNFLVLFLLFLLQFVYFPFGTSYWEIPKVYVAECFIFLLVLWSLFRGRFSLDKRSLFVPACFGSVFYLSVFHLIFRYTEYTFWGNPFRMQGVLLLWFLLTFGFLSSLFPVKRLPTIFLWAVFLLQCFLAFWVDSGGLGRAVGTLGEPNSLAGEMVFLWPFVMGNSIELGLRQKLSTIGIKNFESRAKLLRMFWLLLLLIGVLGVILFSGSRSGLVAFVLQLIFLGGVGVFRWSFKKCAVLCVVLLFLSYSLPFVDRGSLYENRGEVWQSAVVAGFYHPVFGNGFGNTEFSLHRANIQLHNHLQGYYVDSSHNVFLDWFVQGGVVGLSLFGLLVWRALRDFVRGRSLRNILLLFGLLGVMSFNPVSVVLLVGFWWLMAQNSG